jgi:hypothetical protein
MASILRRGRIPAPPTGISEYIDQVYSLKGFFGPWAQLFRKHNTAHVISASRPDLIYQGLDTSGLEPTDARDPAGAPLVLLQGSHNAVAIAARGEAAPFALGRGSPAYGAINSLRCALPSSLLQAVATSSSS